MNIIDFVIIFVILFFMGLGYYRGFFRVVMNLTEYILGIFLAFKFYPKFAEFLNEKFFFNDFINDVIINGIKSVIESTPGNEGLIVPVENLNLPILASLSDMIVMLISIIILFILFKLLIKIVGLFIDKLTKLPILKEFNKIGGVVAGLIEGVLVVFISLAIINCFSNEAINQKMRESLMGDKFSSVVANFTVSIINKL